MQCALGSSDLQLFWNHRPAIPYLDTLEPQEKKGTVGEDCCSGSCCPCFPAIVLPFACDAVLTLETLVTLLLLFLKCGMLWVYAEN